MIGFLLWLFVGGFGGLYGSQEARMSFDLPEGKAIETLRKAALQGEIQILFSDSVVDGVMTKAIRGHYTPREALDLMLKGTGLGIAQAHTNGAYAITLADREIEAGGSNDITSTTESYSENKTETEMNAKKNNWFKTLAAVLTLGIGVGELSGQPISEDKTVQLEPFVISDEGDIGYYSANAVTASRLRVPLKELPAGISIINSQLIEDTLSTNFDELVFYSSSLEDAGSNPGGFRLRGFGATQSIDTTQLFSQVPIDPAFVERVEVVKGPQAVLYGIVPVGGMVNIVTKKPFGENRSRLDITAKRWDDYRVTADTSGVIYDGDSFSASYRAVALYQDKGDHFEKFAKLKVWGISPSLLLNFNEDRTSILLQGIFQDWNQIGNDNGFVPFDRAIDQILPNIPLDFNHQGPFSFTDRGVRHLSGTLTHKINDSWSFRSHLVYQEQIIQTLEPVGVREIAEGTRIIRPQYQRRGRIDGQGNVGPQTKDLDIQTDVVFQPELDSNAIDEFTLVLGHLYRKGHFDSYEWRGNRLEFSVDDDLDTVDFRPVGFKDMTFRSYRRNRGEDNQLLAMATVKTMDRKLSIIGGARYISNSASSLFITNPHIANEPTVGELSDTTWQLGGVYQLSDKLSAFVNVSRSIDPNLSFPNNPQEGKGVDAGIKMEGLLDGKLSGSVVVFDLERTNIPRRNFFTQELELSGVEAAKGVEVELYLSPIEGWDTIATMSFLDHEVASDLQNLALEGAPLSGTPDFSASLWSNYKFQSGNLAGFRLGLGVIHKGELVRPLSGNFFRNLGPLDSWTRLDLVLGYDFRFNDTDANIALKLENITDERYWRSPVIYGEPRNWTISVSMSF